MKAKAATRAKADAEVEAKAKERVKAEAEVKAKADAKAEAEAEGKLKAEAEAKARAEAQVKSKGEAKATPKAEAVAEAEVHAKAAAEDHCAEGSGGDSCMGSPAEIYSARSDGGFDQAAELIRSDRRGDVQCGAVTTDVTLAKGAEVLARAKAEMFARRMRRAKRLMAIGLCVRWAKFVRALCRPTKYDMGEAVKARDQLGLTKWDCRIIEGAFDMIDVDGSGSLNYDEFS